MMQHRAAQRLSVEGIRACAAVIDPVFRHSPQYRCEPLSEALGTDLLVKVETANPIRSFKGRGACAFGKELTEGDHVVAASAGNFGQALAYVCRQRGVPLTLYAAETANAFKVERMRALGAEVVLHGNDFDAAKAEARRRAEAKGWRMVEDGRERAIAEGAGSIALELVDAGATFDAALIALGNGALIGGIGRVLKELAPGVEVIGVAASGAPAMARSWRAGRPVETKTIDTIADGIGTRVAIPEALADMNGTVDDVVLIDDAAMIDAMRLAHRHLGLVLEPSGAVGIAEILANPARYRDRRTVTVLCGGNLTEADRRRWLC